MFAYALLRNTIIFTIWPDDLGCPYFLQLLVSTLIYYIVQLARFTENMKRTSLNSFFILILCKFACVTFIKGK